MYLKSTVYSNLNIFDQAETCTEKMMELGNLNYEVVKMIPNVHFPEDDYTLQLVEDAAVIRTDTRSRLGMVSARYGLVQNVNVAEISNVWIENGDAHYVAAGAPNNGERIYIVLRTGDVLDLGGNEQDKIENYFFLTSSHDGSEAIVGYPAPVHVRSCSVIAFPDRKLGGIKVKHSCHAQKHVANARKILSGVMDFWQRFVESFNLMRDTEVSDKLVMGYIKEVVGGGDSTRTENRVNAIFDIYKSGASSQMPYARGTIFGAYLACITYADHDKTVRQSKKRNEGAAQLHARLIGDGAKMKAEAMAFAMKLRRDLGGKGK